MRYEPVQGVPKRGGCQSGTYALAAAVRTALPELQSLTSTYGCYNYRPITGTGTWSLHAEGRAFDVGVRPTHKELGWWLACHLVDRRTFYGTMRVIWDKHIWSTETPSEWRRLKSTTNQHTDHVHVEQFRAAAARPKDYQTQYTVSLQRARPKG